jgi:membrane protein YdbS with pleckstrin-like domain
MRKVFTELDSVCANTSGFIGVIAAATIIIAVKVIVSFVVCCFIIYQKWRYDFAEYYCY